MKVDQFIYDIQKGWQKEPGPNDKVQLVFLFCSSRLPNRQKLLNQVNKNFTNAVILGCTTAGEIFDTFVFDDSMVITAIELEKTQVEGICIPIASADESQTVGEQISEALSKEGLNHVVVLSEGLNINGSELVKGLRSKLDKKVNVTGGLSADGDSFEVTEVVSQGRFLKNCVSAVGFYGDSLKVGYASLGGWDPFGPYRTITKSNGNVLYELDGENALGLYKKYLGEHAKDLPASGLRFPLSLKGSENEKAVVRTILGISEEDKSMTFAGDMPEGGLAQFMKANFERLIDGATDAAHTAHAAIQNDDIQLALLISCVGRKLVLKQRIEEEVEAVREVVGDRARLTGFYSYGEISPFSPDAKCELHNQTMAITTFSES